MDVIPPKLQRTPAPIKLKSSKSKSIVAIFYRPQNVGDRFMFRMEIKETKRQGFKPTSRANIIFFAESWKGYGTLKRILKAYQAGKIRGMYVDGKTWDK